MPCNVTIYLKEVGPASSSVIRLTTVGSKAETLDRLTTATRDHEAIMGCSLLEEGQSHWVPWHNISHVEVTEIEED